MRQQKAPDALDAMIAAPQHHKLLLENEFVRVLDTCIGPGQTTALHTHCWGAMLYVRSWSNFVRRDAHGAVLLDSRTTPPIPPDTAVWSDPLAPHILQNVGDGELRVIAVELKRQAKLLPAFTTVSALPGPAKEARRRRSRPRSATS